MSQSGEIVFVLSKKGSSETSEVPVSSETDSNLRKSTETVESGEPEYVLSVLWKSGSLGASYYDITTRQLFVFTDMLDPNPEFANARSLLRHLPFKHVITVGNPCDNFVKLIIDWINNKGDDTVDSDQIRQVPGNLSLLPMSEFSYVTCEMKIFNLKLPGIPEDTIGPKNEAYYHSLMDFNNKLSVHSLGALVKFVEMSWAYLNNDDTVPEVKFLHINQISMENQVYIDNNTMRALQIFQKRSHDAKFKRGSECGNREGLSIFKLFVENCRSKLGVQCLRRLLLTPLKDINELNKRLNFIEFAIQPQNSGFIEGLQESIKKIQEIDHVLNKIQYSRATSYDWEIFYKTMYNTLYINDLCLPYKLKSDIFGDLVLSISPDLYVIENCIRDSLDFSDKWYRNRPIIKTGVDEDLDKKRTQRQDIRKYLSAAANLTVNQLPDYLHECTVIYIPEMGHLLALKKSEHNSDPEQLEYLGFQFMFEIHDTFHYKNALCKELDKHVGQLQNDIIEHEIRIIQRLSGLVLRSIKIIKEPITIIVLLDCLIAMAKVVKEHNYIRPTLNSDNVMEIVDGRHALFEVQCSNFVPNNYFSGGNNSRVKIITGPNSCGKSLYLKQTALLVYMAHIGCFVPATSAKIGVVDAIYTCMRVNESASLPLSAFMIDLTQMARTFHVTKPNSLILIDEFGKSTTGEDGLALLAAALKHFLKDEHCPHVLVATHFQQIHDLLQPSPMLSYSTFDFTKNNDDIILLFKLIDGISGSCAFDVALSAGLDKNVVKRAREIHQAMLDGTNWAPENDNLQVHDLKYLLNIEIPPLD